MGMWIHGAQSVSCLFPGLTEPVLIRLDVDTKLSDQLKVRVVRLLMELGFCSHTVHHGSTVSITSDHQGRWRQGCMSDASRAVKVT